MVHEVDLSKVKFNADGLVCAVAQDTQTHAVLMVAWMNREALTRTLTSRRAVYWSRSRQELWRKGDTSGHTQKIVDVRLDCDGDAILLLVNQSGAACHTGAFTCFNAGGSLLEQDTHDINSI